MASRRARIILTVLYIICVIAPVSAQSLVDGGAVDYNMGAEGLYNMTEFLLVMMHYVTLVVFCIGALTALVDAFMIYVRMNNQEGDVSKSMLKLFGACVFLVIATYVLPGFFGIVRSDNVMFSW